jgi:outer membrane receptor protein involved in Fe transport
VPITGKPLVKWLELSAAVRGFNYNTFGSDFTWKTGVLWKMPEGVSIRGTYSTAFRAPSIADLYLGASDSFPSVTDPCSTDVDGDGASDGPLTGAVGEQCAEENVPTDFVDQRTQLREKWGGNPEVEPETATIATGGLVYEPPKLSGLAVTLDYFWVHVENSIQRWGASTILASCYQFQDPTACALIDRNPTTHLIDIIDDRQTNVGGDKTAGLDFQIRYDWTHKTAGRFRHNLEGTYLLKYNSYIPDPALGLRVIEGVGVYDVGVYPRIRANFSTLWGLKDFGAGLNVRYIHSYDECIDDDCDTYREQYSPDELVAEGYENGYSRTIDANITADVFASYELSSAAGNSTLTLGVNNVLDQDPPWVYNSFLNTSDEATYDFMGRYFYLRFSQAY